jgi:hypothetical protein
VISYVDPAPGWLAQQMAHAWTQAASHGPQRLLQLASPYAYRIPHHSNGGMSDIFRIVAHAAIWSAVGRLMWSLPGAGVIVVAAGAAAWLLMHRRSRN